METENNSRVFTLSKGWRIFWAISAILSLGVSILLIVILPGEIAAYSISLAVLHILGIALFMLAAVYSVFLLKRYRITIAGTVIAEQGLFLKKEVDLSRFDSYRVLVSEGVHNFTFFNQCLGINEGERIAAIKRAARINTAAGFTVILVTVLSFVLRQYAGLFIVILGVIPFIALMVIPASNGSIKFDTARNSPYPSVALWFIVPIIALTLKSALLYMGRILNWERVILPMLLLTLLITVVFFVCHAKEKKTKSIIGSFLFFALLYGFAAAITFNTLGTQELVETHLVVVQDKSIREGRRTTRYLHIPQWGNQEGERRVAVGRHLFDSIEINDTVVVRVFNGMLGLRYFRIAGGD